MYQTLFIKFSLCKMHSKLFYFHNLYLIGTILDGKLDTSKFSDLKLTSIFHKKMAHKRWHLHFNHEFQLVFQSFIIFSQKVRISVQKSQAFMGCPLCMHDEIGKWLFTKMKTEVIYKTPSKKIKRLPLEKLDRLLKCPYFNIFYEIFLEKIRRFLVNQRAF